MASTTANGITIEYETFGDRSDEPLLLVMGFGAQLVYWPPELVRGLADHGYFVVIYDNRDVGLSTKFDDFTPPALNEAFAGGRPAAPYALEDMAADGIGLLDALGIGSAHIVGASMGGFIVQTMAITWPGRVRSLCSIMSSTGDPTVPPASPEASAALVTPPATSREEAIELGVKTSRIIGSPGFAFDEEWIRARAGASYDRCFCPEGRTRQALAIMSASDRTVALGKVAVPTLVIHGAADPLVSPVGGERTAKAVPGADLLMIDGMGHDLPRGACPQIVDAIVANARKAVV